MNAFERLSESDKDIALAQAVALAEYVTRQAKGTMAAEAQRFLSLPYSQEVAARLAAAPAAPAVVVDEAMDLLRRYSAHLRSQAESEIDDECHAELLAEVARVDKALTAALSQGKQP